MVAARGVSRGVEDIDAGCGSGNEVGDVVGEGVVGVECQSTCARVMVQWEASAIKCDSRVNPI